MSTDKTMPSIHYPALLAEIRQRIQSAQTRAMLGANAELIRLYWEIGQMLDARQKSEGWGRGGDSASGAGYPQRLARGEGVFRA